MTTGIEVNTSGVSGGQVVADESDIVRIIENLTSNASRYAHKRVALSVSESDGWVTLRVTDDGPGIPLEKREIVFERFPTSSRRSGPGEWRFRSRLVNRLGPRHQVWRHGQDR